MFAWLRNVHGEFSPLAGKQAGPPLKVFVIYASMLEVFLFVSRQIAPLALRLLVLCQVAHVSTYVWCSVHSNISSVFVFLRCIVSVIAIKSS